MTTPLLARILVAARGLLYASAFVALWAWLAVSVRRYDRQLAFALPAWLQPVGLALALGGGLLVAWCVATFVTIGQGTPAPFDPPRRFVATGPYRFVRNPMYLGAAGVIAGAGFLLGSAAILALAAAFLLIAHLFVVLYEEPSLEGRFGPEYVRYLETVRRWLPGARVAARPSRQADPP